MLGTQSQDQHFLPSALSVSAAGMMGTVKGLVSCKLLGLHALCVMLSLV